MGADTKSRTIARAVGEAQQLANADGRSYLVVRGVSRSRPFVTPFAGLEGCAGTISKGIAETIAAGTILVVPPQGMHHGLAGAEILAAEIAAVQRAADDERLRLDAAFADRYRERYQ